MNGDVTDVAVIGAGPYGLSVAAHLSRAGVRRRVFGRPMEFWRANMPDAMLLKSTPAASSLSDPAGARTLTAYYRHRELPALGLHTPIPRDMFAAYGEWFQRDQVPDVEPTLVTRLDAEDGGFALALSTGEQVFARSVVVAVGLQYFTHTPVALSGLPSSVASHSSAHVDVSGFRGRDVLVVGGGQSALELAVLLSERGAQVRLMARGPRLQWNDDPQPPHRPLVRRLREPDAPLGSGWRTWFDSEHPELFRHLPANMRIRRARTAFGPAGAWWLRPRFEGGVPVLLGCLPVAAEPIDGGVRVRGRTTDGEMVDVETEHVIAATGFRPDVTRLPFLTPSLRNRIRIIAGEPLVDEHFTSSVPGLHFVGATVMSTFGPAMRFVWGAHFTARILARHLSATPAEGVMGRRPYTSTM